MSIRILSPITGLRPTFTDFIPDSRHPTQKFVMVRHLILFCIRYLLVFQMEYTQDFERFRALFSDENEEITIPGSGIKICNVDSRSDIPQSEFMNASDKFIGENSIFSYPVFVPRIPGNRKVILLFHGLNERSWLKYLS